MIRSLLALVAIIPGLGFAYGYACRFLPTRHRDLLTLILVTFGLSLGWLTLWMFWITMLMPGRLSLGLILGGVCLAGLVGLSMNRHDLKPAPGKGDFFKALWRLDVAGKVLAGVVVVLCASILLNSVYWPFSDEDALVIYAPLAKDLFRTRVLPIGLHLYEGYPALVPMAYAFTHLAYGEVNEYLARLIPGLMALGSVGAAGALGRAMRSERTGLVAAGLVVLTPFFCRWASSGYVDVPASFYFALTALFAWHWLTDGGGKNAVLTGLFAGFAMWTKNNALTLLMSMGGLLVYRWWMGRRQAKPVRLPPWNWRQITLLVGGIVATAAPWYVRNLIVFDFIVPPTLWADAAEHSLLTLFMMARAWPKAGATGVIFTLSILYGLANLLWRFKAGSQAAWMILLIMIVPFYAAWWWLASYDLRFLVMIVPPLAVMAGLMLDDFSAAVRLRLSPISAAHGQWAVAICVLALTPHAAGQAVIYKWSIISRPFMNNTEKHHIVLGGLFDVALAINNLPSDSRIVGVPSAARYHIDLSRLKTVSEEKVDLPPARLADDYDYVVYRLADTKLAGQLGAAPPLLMTTDGYYLFAVPASSH